MSKYYAIHDIDENGGNVQKVLSVRQILKERTQFAEEFYSGYPSAQTAILDFVVAHWAYPCTKEGKIKK